MIKEEQLLEQKELRDSAVNRIEVLEKVKNLFTIPQTDLMSINQVAEYYSTIYTKDKKDNYFNKNKKKLKDIIITSDTIRKLYQNNKEEINEDGTWLKNYKDFLMGNNFTLETSRGKATIYYNDDRRLDVPNRGLRVFSKRAVLRIGLLLRDSIVAKEIRTQVLNCFENTPDEIKVQDISEEQSLAMSLGMAQASGDITAITIATGNLMAFKNRHIKMQEEHINKLQNDNKALAGEILKWEDRSKINFAIRKLARSLNKVEGCIWTELYKDLKYKYHIDVKLRGEKPWIKHIRENEWDKVMKTFSALCEKNDVSPSSILGSLNGGYANE